MKPELPVQLTELQEEVFTGTMLGDACVTSARVYQFKQCEQHLEYVEHVCNVLKPFSDPAKIYRGKNKKPNNIDGKVINLDHWNGEYMYSYLFRTRTSPIFTTARNLWYPDGKKIIPTSLKLTPRTVAYWFMDDGSSKHRARECQFSTQGFTNAEADGLIDRLKTLGIKCTRQKRKSGPIVAVSCKRYWDLMDMISPFVTMECLKYKVDTSNTTRAKEGWCPGKLNMRKAQEIRSLYNTDKYTQKQLAEMYAVSVAIIWRVINDKIYKKINPGFSGSADVQLTFKVEACPSEIKTGQSTNSVDPTH